MADDTKYKPSDLSADANFALAYAYAVVGGKNSVAYKRFVAAERRLPLSGDDKRRMLQKGLNELLARGIVEAERNGEGDYVPTTLHVEKLESDGGPLLLVN